MKNLSLRLLSSVILLGLLVAVYYLPLLWQQILVAGIFMLSYQEWQKCARLTPNPLGFLSVGAVYILSSMAVSLLLLTHHSEIFWALILMVIATDSLAYCFGRVLGGPKIAPKISPSKTWAGLLGGIIGSILMGQLVIYYELWHFPVDNGAIVGVAVAVFSQMGDFLESWLKRNANVKDSGQFIPGHGGILDRFDGHIMAQLMGVYFLM